MKYKSGVILTAIAILFLVLPEAVLFYIKRDVYFVDNQGADIAMGGMLLLVFTMLMVFGALKNIDPMFKTMFGLSIMLAVTYYLNAILSDLFWIILCGLIGFVFFAIFFKMAQRKFDYAKSYRSEKARIQAREDYAGNV